MPQQIRRQKASLLVVDPSPISLTAVAGVMDAQGYDCYCARGCEAAGKAIDQAPLDLVLWDVTADADASLNEIQSLREAYPGKLSDVPFILLADNCWAGLEMTAQRDRTGKVPLQTARPQHPGRRRSAIAVGASRHSRPSHGASENQRPRLDSIGLTPYRQRNGRTNRFN
ncbi:MAG: hypothetical protein R3C05_02105 [Pirellulaceae bacterium]